MDDLEIEGDFFVCVHCGGVADKDDVVEKAVWLGGGERKIVTVYCKRCKVHSHFLKKGLK